MKKGSPVVIIISAIAIVAIVSLLPLSKWSGGWIKDFSLVSDVLKTVGINVAPSDAVEEIDPELLKMQSEAEQNIIEENPDEPIDTIISPVKPSRVGDIVMIEDYTTREVGLKNLKNALDSGRLARIAVVGDSYIEGDIFTQDLRNLLQSAYGGEGVGFVNMHSDFPGFRRSVRQSGDGWKIYTTNHKADKNYIGISEQYAKLSAGEATALYEGAKLFETTKSWSCSRFLFISPNDATIKVKVSDAEWEDRAVIGSPEVQCLKIDSLTSKLGIKTKSSSLIAFGVWLDGVASGVSLDCMSLRGFSGVTMTKVNQKLSREMAKFIDYDLIILEFGINAMSSTQKKYNVYSSRMVDVINHVRQCYPHADILLMGIGDRGEKVGTQVKSMSTAPAMVSAQRDAARRAHCLFWDTREAMGGENAVVGWSASGDINKDYIHMTHKGGARLAGELFKAIQSDLKQ